MTASRLPCPHDGCPGLEMHNGRPDGCGHGTLTDGCPHAADATLWKRQRAIWKFPLPVADTAHVTMPKGAVVLTVAVQDGAPHLWAIVDPAAPLVERPFAVRGTGHALGVVGAYIGTFMLLHGGLVFHVFDAVTPTAHEAF